MSIGRTPDPGANRLTITGAPQPGKRARPAACRLELSQQQLESLASGVVLSFDWGGHTLEMTADAEAVAAFKQHVYQALLAHVNQSNQSIQ
jgi:hypothetical protein